MACYAKPVTNKSDNELELLCALLKHNWLLSGILNGLNWVHTVIINKVMLLNFWIYLSKLTYFPNLIFKAKRKMLLILERFFNSN